MDARLFDALARSLTVRGSRRRVPGLFTTLPLVGGLIALLQDDSGADAKGRRKRRKKAHKHGRPRTHGKHKHHKKRCKPPSTAETCAGKCGPVKNACKKTVDCGPCLCGGVICGTDQVCDDETCQDCDVCPTCTHATIQDAIDAASSGATIRICAGTYTRNGKNRVADINAKDLTLVGAGAGRTILDGAGVFTGNPVLVCAQTTSALRQLTVTGSNGISGIVVFAQSTVAFADVTVTENTTNNGGGIRNFGTVILEAGTRVTDNPVGTDGGGIHNAGSLTLRDGSSVTDNLADKRGGGIFNAGGSVTLQAGSRVTDNTANVGGGGGIFSIGGSVTLEPGSLVCDNSEPQCVGFTSPSGFCGACP